MHLDALRSLRIPPVRHDYSFKDAILYALGLGYGSDPVDPDALQFVYEQAQKVVPSMSVVLGYPGFWLQAPELRVDWVQALHAEHFFEIHRPLSPDGTVHSSHKIVAVDDKGAGKGALLHVQKQLHDDNGLALATLRETYFLRGDGGCGSFGTPPIPAPALPDRAPNLTTDIATLPQQALIYRLSGDYNPIHADPVMAAQAGFERPILIGLCTMGIATRAAISCICNADPDRLASMFVRFVRPVYPGETLRFEFFGNTGEIQFRARSVERNELVLDRCKVTVRHEVS